ncbi:MAG: lysozyme [Cyanobacteria bacterium J06649_4]
MGTWIKETEAAFYLMEGGYYLSKISKYPSKRNPQEKVVNIAGMKSWFSRSDAPRGMTVAKGGPEPKAKPAAVMSVLSEEKSSDSAGATTRPKRTNRNGLLLIKSFEGLRLRAYRDAVGIWTIGYGTTRGVRPNMTISEQQAIEFLQQDLARFEKSINDAVQVPINDNQFSALSSFTYNVGPGALRSSTLLRLLNKGDIRGAADQFPRWNKAGGRELAGLTRRRNAERLLFLGEDFHTFL